MLASIYQSSLEVLRFIRWAWCGAEYPTKFGIIFGSSVIFVLTSIVLFGIKALAIFILLGFLSIIVFMLFLLGRMVWRTWLKFKAERELEAQHIVDRLSGKPEGRIDPSLETLKALAGIRARKKL